MSILLYYTRLSLIAVVALAGALFASVQLLQTTVAEAEVLTYPFKLTKSISDNYTPDPYTANEFKFNVSGYGTVELNYFTNDTAEKVIYLQAGTYTIEEVGPFGFVPADWTLQWSGPGCETDDDGNGPVRPIEITVVETSIDYPGADDVGNACKADNQWRPNDDNGDPNPEPVTGTLLVSKVIVGTTTVPASNFSFTYTGAVGNIPFELDGTNALTLATGTYVVTEATSTGYTTTSSNCSNISVLAGATTTPCVITNTLNSTTTDGGGGSTATGTLLVSKVIVGTTTVPTSNFSFTYTGAVGNIAFEQDGTNALTLATGTYSVTEAASVGYTVSYSNCSNISVLAGATTTPCVITNTLNATTTDGGGGDNNNGGNGGNNNSNGGNGNGGSSSGGRSNRNNDSGGGQGGGIADPTPMPLVLGDATSIMPVGAPNTGAGRTAAPVHTVLPMLLAILTTAVTVRRTK